MNTSEAPDALIIGGGVAGLTSALALAAHGWHPTVLERAPAITAVGAGVQLSPNACRVLARLDVLPALQRSAVAPTHLEMLDGRHGRPYFSVPAGAAAARRWGAPYLHVHRADLIDALAAAFEARCPGRLHTDSSVARLDPGDASVQCTNGRRYAARLLVGADGIRSTTRSALFGDAPARFSGNVAWRCTVPTEALGELAPPATARVWVGAGRHAVTYRVRGGEAVNFVGVVETQDAHTESWTSTGTAEAAHADFAGWHPTLHAIIAAADTLHRWGLFDRPPLNAWSRDSAVLVGDACHPMLPFLAQGAAMAIEDAWVLAAALSDTPALPDALARYAAARQGRTARVQRAARANQTRFHANTALARARYWRAPQLAARVAPAALLRALDWLYGTDVTTPARHALH